MPRKVRHRLETWNGNGQSFLGAINWIWCVFLTLDKMVERTNVNSILFNAAVQWDKYCHVSNTGIQECLLSNCQAFFFPFCCWHSNGRYWVVNTGVLFADYCNENVVRGRRVCYEEEWVREGRSEMGSGARAKRPQTPMSRWVLTQMSAVL